MFVELPSLDALRAYLNATGWSRIGSEPGLQVWTFPADSDGPGGEVLVPVRERLLAGGLWSHSRIAEAVRVVAAVEQRCADEVAQNMITSVSGGH